MLNVQKLPPERQRNTSEGLALQFKQAFPESFVSYERSCRAGEVITGQVHIVERPDPPRYIINFPTKKHWKQTSQPSYVRCLAARAVLFEPSDAPGP
jgi:hypothetical protein